jgi:hypothetical protein
MKEKKDQRFFERTLDNNLENLYSFLLEKNNELVEQASKEMGEGLDKALAQDPGILDAIATKNSEKYNLWTFDNPEIKKLKNAIADMTKEACAYYEYNDSSSKFITHAWFNLDKKIEDLRQSVDPRKESSFFHDHMDGSGFPQLHGFYCVKAEPSSTYYKINNKDIFENVNKNNRAILSETGNPHGRGNWYEDEPRMTIAYDVIVVPNGPMSEDSIFTDLFE